MFLLKKNLNKNNYILFFISPLIYLIYPLLKNFTYQKILNLKYKIERKKQVKEIPKLVEYLKSYLKSGIQTSQAIKIISEKNKWSQPIKNSLTKITNYYSQGMSFESSIHMAILSLTSEKGDHFLIFFLTSLRLGHMSGGNMVSILDKVKIKIESSIFIEQKIKSTTAQMRFQSIIISLAPLAIAFVIWFIFPSYILFFINNEVGIYLLTLMILLNLVGFYLLKLISRLN